MANIPPRFVGVIDIGKTNAKFAVVDLESRSEIAVRKMPNTVLQRGTYPQFDVEVLWTFLTGAIAELNAIHKLDALSITTHGASAALVAEDGSLVLPVLDYEHAGPDALDADYSKVRPPFSESFTPPLPGGLNLGKQLFWQARRFPEAFAKAKWILTYPQYWSFRLTGVAASEITSIGCHTDLWDFNAEQFSSLVRNEGWTEKFPPIRPASDALGPVLPELAQRLGLPEGIPVHCGIHDSNASLLPHVLTRTPPFAVVSTGTWVVICAPGGDLVHLDPARDSFSNIDALGHHVPSARFMGGREFSLLTNGETPAPVDAVINRVLDESLLLLPSVVEGSGPFPHRKAQWTHAPETLDEDTRHTVISFYLALVTAECLNLAGAKGETVVEGPFASNPLFITMLAAATGRPVEAQTSSATGTSIGAALLANMESEVVTPPLQNGWTGADATKLDAYVQAWRKALAQ
jgi:sugar (pentulose or hexulose) kinase